MQKGQKRHFLNAEPNCPKSSVATKFLKYNGTLHFGMHISKRAFNDLSMHRGGREVAVNEVDLDFLSIGTALTYQKHT